MAKNITDEEMVKLEACQTADDWANACDEIKAARGGIEYPDDWWAKVKTSGLMQRIMDRWGDSSELSVKTFGWLLLASMLFVGGCASVGPEMVEESGAFGINITLFH